MIGGELSCKREPTNRVDRFAVAVTSRFEVATPQHLHTTAPVNSCRSGVGYGTMYATVMHQFSVVGLLWTNKSFIGFIFEGNVLNEIFENKFPSKITRYTVIG